MSAAMSSMDSVLLVAGSVVMRDVVGNVVKVRDEKQTAHTRIGVIGCAVLAALFALNQFGDIVEITTVSGSLYAVCFVLVIIVGLHWHKGSAPAVLFSFGSGIATVLIWRHIGLSAVLHEVGPALVVSLIVYVLVAKFTPHVESVNVTRFFETKSVGEQFKH